MKRWRAIIASTQLHSIIKNLTFAENFFHFVIKNILVILIYTWLTIVLSFSICHFSFRFSFFACFAGRHIKFSYFNFPFFRMKILLISLETKLLLFVCVCSSHIFHHRQWLEIKRGKNQFMLDLKRKVRSGFPLFRKLCACHWNDFSKIKMKIKKDLRDHYAANDFRSNRLFNSQESKNHNVSIQLIPWARLHSVLSKLSLFDWVNRLAENHI